MPSPYIASTRVKYPKPADKKNRQLNVRVDDDTFALLLDLKKARGNDGLIAPFARQLLMEKLQEMTGAK
tara:strand:- start:243 stop:449 length:207 start_codon:yes stop_codon:yes gene_type:complete